MMTDIRSCAIDRALVSGAGDTTDLSSAGRMCAALANELTIPGLSAFETLNTKGPGSARLYASDGRHLSPACNPALGGYVKQGSAWRFHQQVTSRPAL